MNDNTSFTSALLYGHPDVKNGLSLVSDISSQIPSLTHFKYLLRFSIFRIPQYLPQISLYSVDACTFSVRSTRQIIERLDLSLVNSNATVTSHPLQLREHQQSHAEQFVLFVNEQTQFGVLQVCVVLPQVLVVLKRNFVVQQSC